MHPTATCGSVQPPHSHPSESRVGAMSIRHPVRIMLEDQPHGQGRSRASLRECTGPPDIQARVYLTESPNRRRPRSQDLHSHE